MYFGSVISEEMCASYLIERQSHDDTKSSLINGKCCATAYRAEEILKDMNTVYYNMYVLHFMVENLSQSAKWN